MLPPLPERMHTEYRKLGKSHRGLRAYALVLLSCKDEDDPNVC